MSFDSLLNVGFFIGAIALLIIVHELGHFIVARLFNVEVEEFGLGFPPRAVKLFEAKGTIYSLNWLPLGGFVRPKGENDPTVEGGLAAANPWVRLAVFLAGPVMNLLTAAVLYAIIFTRVGVPISDQIQIMDVNDNSPASLAGLQAGDIITAIDGLPITSAEILREAIAAHAEQDTEITYLRGEETGATSLVPRSNPPPGEGSIGIMFGHPSEPAPLLRSLLMGGGAVFEQGRLILTIPAQIAQGALAADEARLLGYKGMYDMYQNVKESDTSMGVPEGTNSLAFFASISVSLGLLNLLPIPALDGGRILFTLPEILIRRRIPTNYENLINFVSITALILLMLYINLQDFVNPAEFR